MRFIDTTVSAPEGKACQSQQLLRTTAPGMVAADSSIALLTEIRAAPSQIIHAQRVRERVVNGGCCGQRKIDYGADNAVILILCTVLGCIP